MAAPWQCLQCTGLDINQLVPEMHWCPLSHCVHLPISIALQHTQSNMPPFIRQTAKSHQSYALSIGSQLLLPSC
jgi:hypothetical protein